MMMIYMPYSNRTRESPRSASINYFFGPIELFERITYHCITIKVFSLYLSVSLSLSLSSQLCLLSGEQTVRLSSAANSVLYQLSGLHFHGIFNKIIFRFGNYLHKWFSHYATRYKHLHFNHSKMELIMGYGSGLLVARVTSNKSLGYNPQKKQ